MAEQKKAPRQASIAAFFSPQKSGEKLADAFLASPVAPSTASSAEPAAASGSTSGTKRPRARSDTSTSPASDGKASKTSKTKKSPPKPPRKAAKKKKTPAARPKAKPKARAAPKPQKVIRTSPHAMIDGEDDDLDDDLDDEDVDMEAMHEAVSPSPSHSSPEQQTKPQTEEKSKEKNVASSPSPSPSSTPTDKATATTETSEIPTVDLSEDVEEATADEKATTGEPIDLTAAATPSVAAKSEEPKPKQTRRKAVRPPASTSGGKSRAKTPTKRQQQQQLKKEKAAAAAAAADAKAKSPEPLDPVTQARVDTYKLKMEELARQHTQLQHSNEMSDAVMQEILGVAVDCGLDVTVDPVKAQQTLMDTWQKLREASHAEAAAPEAAALPSTVEFPHEVKSLLVKKVQGRSASLSALSSELLASFQKDVAAAGTDAEKEPRPDGDKVLVDRAAALQVEMEIKMLAQRTAYGVRPAKANVFEDTSADALWVWEVGNLEKYFEEDAQKTVKRMRKHRKRLGQQLKTLARVVQLLHQSPVDEVKVSAEEAKVGKFGLVVEAELQRARDRERKEQEKLEAAEEKKRQEQERQQVQEDEKRKRELESEAEKLEATKRRKSLVSYFRSIDQSGAEAAASVLSGDGTKSSAIDLVSGLESSNKDVELVLSSDETMAQMDAVLGYLVSSGDAKSCATESATGSERSIFTALKDKREMTKKRASAHAPHSWSCRRERDPKLGVMKLLQYYENHRPAYYGTFGQRSRLFRGGRRPFAQYPKFDYTVDSDDEWEEEEPGESLSGAESDGDDSDEDNLDYGDQWLAYEDEVDYMDDAGGDGVDGSLGDDPMDGGAASSSPTKHKLPSQLLHKKQRVKRNAVKPEKLEPVLVGPFWSDSVKVGESHFPNCCGQQLSEPVFESTLMRKAREYELEQERLRAVQLEKEAQQKEQQAQEDHKKLAVAQAVAAGPKQASILASVEKMASPSAVRASPKSKTTSTAATVVSAVLSSSPAKAEITAWFKKDGPSSSHSPDK